MLQMDRANDVIFDLFFFLFVKRAVRAQDDAAVRDSFADLALHVVDHRFAQNRNRFVGVKDPLYVRCVDARVVQTCVDAAGKPASEVVELVFVPLGINDGAPFVLVERNELIFPLPDLKERERLVRRQVNDRFLDRVMRFGKGF